MNPTTTQIIKEAVFLKVETTPGKNKINSRSKRTNKIAKKRKGALRDILEINLSKPDSKGERPSLLRDNFLDKKT